MPEVARNGRSNRTKVANRFVLVLVVVLVLGRAFHLRIDELPVINFEHGARAQPYQIEDEDDDEYEDDLLATFVLFERPFLATSGIIQVFD